MELFLLRTAAALVSLYAASSLDFTRLVALVFALSISHNFLAFVYSESRRAYLHAHWRRHVFPLSLLAVAIAAACWFDRPPVYFAFAFHHVFNETYFAQARFRPGQEAGALHWARGAYHLLAFAAITRAELEFYGLAIPVQAYAPALLGCAALFFGLLARAGANGAWREALYESVPGLFAAWSLATKSALLDHVLIYHFFFWAAYPVPRMRAQRRLGSYSFATVGLFAACLLFTPLGPHWGGLNEDQLSYLTRLTAFFHFLSSIALSHAHPAWLKRWFYPEREASPAAGEAKRAA